ncbi:MAG: phospholipase D-like domain-containing protein [Rubrivivax sp.]
MRRAGWSAGLRRRLLLVLLPALGACMSLPAVDDREIVRALPPATEGTLAVLAANSVPQAGANGFRLLVSATEALQARLVLIEQARVSVDLQVYQFRSDLTGLRVVRALRDAAARGVRVRLLLDDMYTAGDDGLWLGLASLPGVEVRLFNPFLAGRDSHFGRLFDAAFGDDRLHRRMHNKLLLADGVLAVAGGRNIGDAYFLRDATQGFFDLDLLCAGVVVSRMSEAFDEYWNSEYSHDVLGIADDGKAPQARLAALTARLDEQAAANPPQLRAAGGALTQEFGRQRLDMLLAPAIVAFDVPTKIENEGGLDLAGLAQAGSQVRLLVAQAIRNAQSDLVVVSPYLIPGPSGVEALAAFVNRGVRVRLMTNSLAATDERMVHVGYRQYRVDVLRAGAELYEWSPAQGGRVMREIVAGGTVLRLHAKCAVVDRRRVYLGSMNFDPRSRDWNTEFGLLIDSPELAEQVLALIDDVLLRAAYRVRLAEDGKSLRWSLANGGGTEHDFEPETDLGSRFLLDLLAPFVPEQML